jgi:hypothetical protein
MAQALRGLRLGLQRPRDVDSKHRPERAQDADHVRLHRIDRSGHGSLRHPWSLRQRLASSARSASLSIAEFEFFGVHDRDDVDNTPSGSFALKPTDDVLNTVTHEGAVPGIFQGVTLTYAATAIRASTFALRLGNVISPREDVRSDEGILHYAVTDRAPTIEIDPEKEAISTLDFAIDDLLGTEVAIAWVFTQPAANSINARTFTFSAPKAQIKTCAEGERNGLSIYNLTLGCNRSAEAGDDEFSLLIEGS